MKTICIYHSVDLDGWMSAAIVKKCFMDKGQNFHLRDVKMEESGKLKPVKNSGIHYVSDVNEDNDPHLHFLGWNYGDVIPDLSGYDEIIMCDISFPKEEMSKLFEVGNGFKFYWIDHHISALKDNKFGVCEDGSVEYAKCMGNWHTKFSACELAWQYLIPNEPMPEIVRLLGRYDCFCHKGTSEEQDVLEFQYAARQRISNYEEAYKYLNRSFDKLGEDDMLLMQEEGSAIYKYLCKEAKQIYKKAFPIEFYNQFGNIKFLCVNQERFNPINFGIDYHKDGYDGCACFHYADGMWKFSLYNDNGEVDCSIIAKRFGGGGHKGASGFMVKDITAFLKSVKL